MQDIFDVTGNVSSLPIRDPIAGDGHSARAHPRITTRDPLTSPRPVAHRRRLAVARVSDDPALHFKGAAHV